ncbi:MAG: preprotein translocase subunit YajC [Desulfotalea sp.]|nr:MAG: preprotein translocase subunit YajC [Desulfotalea sp.]
MLGIAHAAGPAAGAAGGFASFIPLILIFVVFYFLLIRPQQKQAKQHKAFLTDLKKGNKIVTKGGVHGVITGIADNVISLEIARDIVIKVSRDAVSGSLGKDGAPKKEGKKKSIGG